MKPCWETYYAAGRQIQTLEASIKYVSGLEAAITDRDASKRASTISKELKFARDGLCMIRGKMRQALSTGGEL